MKQFLKFVPVQLTFFLIFGIIIGNWVGFQPLKLFISISLLLIVLTFFYFISNKQYQPSIIFTVLVFSIFFFIGISTITYKNELNNKSHYSNCSEFSVEKPLSFVIKIQKELKSNKYNKKYVAVVEKLNSKKAIGRILVNIQKDSTKNSFKVDDNLLVKTHFQNINKPLNPYGFNYRKYLKNQQIHYQIQLDKSHVLLLENKDITAKGLAATLRAKINTSLKNNRFKNNELAVINALLLGQKNSISSDLLESYAGAGAVHILAVSGLHVGIILMLLLFVFKPLHYFKNGKLIATVLIIIMLWVYAVIAGLSPSVVRAVSMFTALTIGMQLVQRSNVYNTLVISLFFLLLFNPFYLFEVGFQLSYLAVFSIVWIQPKLYRLWNSKFWLLDKFWQLFTVSIAAQIGVLPLSLFYFHQFPGLFFLSNLVIIPFLGFILTIGVTVIVLAYFEILPQFIADFYSFVIELMNGFVNWVSTQEMFIIENISFSLALMLAFYAFIFIIIKWIEKKVYYRLAFVFSSIIVIQIIFIFEKYKLQSSNEFIVFNQNKKSLIGTRYGANLTLNSVDTISQNNYVIKPYILSLGIGNNFESNEVKNLYNFKNETFLIVDSLGIFNIKTVNPSILILQNSPKINLERILNTVQPKLIIADGSNYKSYISMWEQTCLKNKTPFHITMQKGAYIFN